MYPLCTLLLTFVIKHKVTFESHGNIFSGASFGEATVMEIVLEGILVASDVRLKESPKARLWNSRV